jgi:hypothetical protein
VRVDFVESAEKYFNRSDIHAGIAGKLRGAKIDTPVDSDDRLWLNVGTIEDGSVVFYMLSVSFVRPAAIMIRETVGHRFETSRLVVLSRSRFGRIGRNHAGSLANDLNQMVDGFLAEHAQANANYSGPIVKDTQKSTTVTNNLLGLGGLRVKPMLNDASLRVLPADKLRSIVQLKLEQAGIPLGHNDLLITLDSMAVDSASPFVMTLKVLRTGVITHAGASFLGSGWSWRSYRFGFFRETNLLESQANELADTLIAAYRKANLQ